MLVRLRAAWEAFRSNLFFVPLLFLLGAAALAFVTVGIDVEIRRSGVVLPSLLRSTVDSARSLLGTVAGATITVAGIAFSVSLLLIQLASSQFSPRVLHGFFRDSFTKRVLGLVVGTFTYCLLVLRAVRGPLGENGEAIVPHISVFVALILGLLSILAIVAFINHSAHSMEVGEIIRRISNGTQTQISRLCKPIGELGPDDWQPAPVPPRQRDPFVVNATSDGWVQQVDVRSLMDAADDGGTIVVETRPGDFRIEGAALVTIWPRPEDEERSEREVRDAIRLGRGRTMQDDLAFGIRQIADIALRALSPGINDPTTAQESIVHLGGILRDLLLVDLPPTSHEDDHGRRLFRPHELTHADHVDLAFDEIRRSGSDHVAVAIALLSMLGQLQRLVVEAGLEDRAGPLRHQAKLLLEGVRRATPLPEDLRRVREHAGAEGFSFR